MSVLHTSVVLSVQKSDTCASEEEAGCQQLWWVECC